MWTNRFWSDRYWVRGYWPGTSQASRPVLVVPPDLIWTEDPRGLIWVEDSRGLIWTEDARGLVWSGDCMLTLTKRQAESAPYAYDFATDEVVASGDPVATITDVAIEAVDPSDATLPILGIPQLADTQVTVVLDQGQDDAIYKLSFTVMTLAGYTRVGLGQLYIQDRV